MTPDSSYEATAVRCFACEARELEMQGYVKAGGSSAGLYVAVDRAQED